MYVSCKSLVILTEKRKKPIRRTAAQKKDDGVFGWSGTAEGEMHRETAGLARGLDAGGKGKKGIWGLGFQDEPLKGTVCSGGINVRAWAHGKDAEAWGMVNSPGGGSREGRVWDEAQAPSIEFQLRLRGQ